MVPLQGAALKLFVGRLASRSTLTDEEQRAVLGLTGRIKLVPAHVDFVRQREHLDHASLIVDGLAGRFGQNRDGARQITCLHIPGDMADLSSVVGATGGWGLTALARTTILQVPHRDLRRLAARHAGVAEAFWRDGVADGSIFSEWVVNVGRRDALARLAHLLCEMAIRNARSGGGDPDSFALPMTQSQLGDATGLTSVHVNRTIRELRMRAVVTMHLGQVTIHDWKGLVAIGDFDDSFMLLDGPLPRLLSAAADR